MTLFQSIVPPPESLGLSLVVSPPSFPISNEMMHKWKMGNVFMQAAHMTPAQGFLFCVLQEGSQARYLVHLQKQASLLLCFIS